MRRLALVVGVALAGPGAEAAQCDPAIVEIETRDGVAAFAVELADTPETRARGLMFRTDLRRDAGMLFVYEAPTEATFWMKNTPLSLDMLFFDPAGRLCGLVERATPYSLDPRPGGCVTKAVLEIHGGLAAEIGVAKGARMRHPAFGEDAAWPCAAARPPAAG